MSSRLRESQISAFDDLLVPLIDRTEAGAWSTSARPCPQQTSRRARRSASSRSTTTPWRPRRSCGIPLACRIRDLVEIAKTHSQQHLLAIAGRRTLNETLTDALMRRGDVNVSNALARNAGAKFSECGYATLVGRAERDESLTEKLGLRLDLPANLLREILSKAADIVLARFLTAPRPALQRKAQGPGGAPPNRPVPPARRSTIRRRRATFSRSIVRASSPTRS